MAVTVLDKIIEGSTVGVKVVVGWGNVVADTGTVANNAVKGVPVGRGVTVTGTVFDIISVAISAVFLVAVAVKTSFVL